MRTDLEKKHFDWILLIIILVLLGIGLSMCASASFVRSTYQNREATRLIQKQLLAAGLGLVALIVTSVIPYKFYKKVSGIVLLVVTALNFYTAVAGAEENGATRWFRIGSRNLFQPSELMKVAIILFVASMLSDEKFGEKAKGFQGLLTVIFPVGIAALSVLAQKHTSATAIVLLLAVSILFFGGFKKRVWVICIISAVFVLGLVTLVKPDLFSHIQARIDVYGHTFLGIVNPEGVPEEYLDQIQNSLWAIGSGGLFGRGFGNSIQKYAYLPECYNDFIFAIVAEELGFVGVVLIIVLFAMLVLRGIKVSTYAEDKFGSLLAVGFTTMIAVQVFLNLSVVSCLIPVTGVSLPFFSYGGTSIAVILGSMGILLNVAKQANYSKFR